MRQTMRKKLKFAFLSKGVQDELNFNDQLVSRRNSCLFALQKCLNILLKLLHRQFKSRCQNAFSHGIYSTTSLLKLVKCFNFHSRQSVDFDILRETEQCIWDEELNILGFS